MGLNVGFQVGDLLLHEASSFNNENNIHNIFRRIEAEVVGVNPLTGQTDVKVLSGQEYLTSPDFTYGIDMIKVGSKTNPNRRSFIRFDVLRNIAPRITVFDGVDDHTKLYDVSCMKVVIGKLSSNLHSWLSPDGYGIYTNNFYGTGKFVGGMAYDIDNGIGFYVNNLKDIDGSINGVHFRVGDPNSSFFEYRSDYTDPGTGQVKSRIRFNADELSVKTQTFKLDSKYEYLSLGNFSEGSFAGTGFWTGKYTNEALEDEYGLMVGTAGAQRLQYMDGKLSVYDKDDKEIFTSGAEGFIFAGWKIDQFGISKGNLKLLSTGVIKSSVVVGLEETIYWDLNADGSGRLAKGNITWDKFGNAKLKDLYIDGNLTIDVDGESGGEIKAIDTLTGAGYRINKDGIVGYGLVAGYLNETLRIPTDPNIPVTFSHGKIYSVEWELTTSAIIRTNEHALQPVNGVSGVVITNAGIFAGEAGQTTGNANVRIMNTGLAEIKGKFHIAEGSTDPNGIFKTDLNTDSVFQSLATRVSNTESVTTTQGTLIQQTKDEILTKAAKSTVDSLTGTVNNMSTSISVMSNALTLKAEKTTTDILFTNLANTITRVNKTESDITILSSSITSKVSNTTYNSDMVAISQQMTTIDQKANSITSSIWDNGVVKSTFSLAVANGLGIASITADKINFNGFTTFRKTSDKIADNEVTFIEGGKIKTQYLELKSELYSNGIYKAQLTSGRLVVLWDSGNPNDYCYNWVNSNHMLIGQVEGGTLSGSAFVGAGFMSLSSSSGARVDLNPLSLSLKGITNNVYFTVDPTTLIHTGMGSFQELRTATLSIYGDITLNSKSLVSELTRIEGLSSGKADKGQLGVFSIEVDGVVMNFKDGVLTGAS